MKYDEEAARLEKYWDEIPPNLRQLRISQALSRLAAEKDAEYAGVVEAARYFVEHGECDYEMRMRHGCCKNGHPLTALKKALASLPAPTSQVMPGEITCANDESKPQEKI